jgi:hypothetical protein
LHANEQLRVYLHITDLLPEGEAPPTISPEQAVTTITNPGSPEDNVKTVLVYAQGYDCLRGVHVRLRWPREWHFERLDASLLPGELLGYPAPGLHEMAFAAAFNPLRGGDVRAIARFDVTVTAPGSVEFDTANPLLQILNEDLEEVNLAIGDRGLVGRPTGDHDCRSAYITRVTPPVGTAGASFKVALRQPLRLAARVYDVSGRLMRSLDAGLVSQSHRIVWDGRNDQGREVPTGVYFIEFRFGASRAMERVVVVR